MLTLWEKERNLKERLRQLGRVAVAYSGGVDSTYLLAVAQEELQEDAMGLFVHAEMISQAEVEESKQLAQTLHFRTETLDLDIFAIDEFIENEPERCYFCKKHLFQALGRRAHELGFTVLDGTNYSDREDYRPGRKALAELGVISPLLEAELSKEEIRELSRVRNLPTWNKPAIACLATRIPYGSAIDKDTLRRIEEAEKILRQFGFVECRLRHHENLARIEIPSPQISKFVGLKDKIIPGLKSLGYRYITLDLEGLRSGSLNPQG